MRKGDIVLMIGGNGLTVPCQYRGFTNNLCETFLVLGPLSFSEFFSIYSFTVSFVNGILYFHNGIPENLFIPLPEELEHFYLT